MNSKTIVVLGDSTSSCFGLEQDNYLFKLAKHKVWPSNFRVVNCSIPGFTSTDAVTYFFNNLNFFNNIHSVVIYLGNCDSMSNELVKGKYSRKNNFLSYIKSKLHINPKKIQLKNKLLHFEWNYNFDSEIEKPISPKSFKYNVEKIVNYCVKKDIGVIIVNPVANKIFPSGTGKGNFIFYHYLGIRDTLSEKFIINDERFISAYSKYENKDYSGASKIYKEMILNPYSSKNFNDLEFQSMLVNNFAASKVMMGDFDEGDRLFEALLGDRSVRSEIILYNLAQSKKYSGDREKYNKFLLNSYEEDKSMYRIRDEYRRSLNDICKKYKSVKQIDMDNIVNNFDFVDHCHCLPNAQKTISNKILNSGCFKNLQGSEQLDIINHIYNPEYSLGNKLTFNEYFKVSSELKDSEIDRIILELHDKVDSLTLYDDDTKKILSEYHKSISISFSYYCKHPLTTRIIDILNLRPMYSYDVGRFPEYFLIRKLIPYLRNIESNDRIYKKFDKSLNLLRGSSDFIGILPNDMKNIVSDKVDDFGFEYMCDWLTEIIKNCKHIIYKHLKNGNQIDNRIKTTMFWYFRESLRFGTHSRISMRYDRIVLENITESLAVASFLDSMTGYKKENYIYKLIQLVESVVVTHEKFCLKIPEDGRDKYMDNYDSELLMHYNLLKGDLI